MSKGSRVHGIFDVLLGLMYVRDSGGGRKEVVKQERKNGGSSC